MLNKWLVLVVILLLPLAVSAGPPPHLITKQSAFDVTETLDRLEKVLGEKASRIAIRPIRRANKRRGHGTYETDRPPVVGTVGRDSGQVRLCVAHHTDKTTLQSHVHGFTQPYANVNTDEWNACHRLQRTHHTVCHGTGEWARDDDGDGIRELHTNTLEGLWTTVRNFLRPFRGVHKKNLPAILPCASCRSIIAVSRQTSSVSLPVFSIFVHEPTLLSSS